MANPASLVSARKSVRWGRVHGYVRATAFAGVISVPAPISREPAVSIFGRLYRRRSSLPHYVGLL